MKREGEMPKLLIFNIYLKSEFMAAQNFQLIVDGVPYMVNATPFDFNGEKRYRVKFDQGEEHIFTWDSSLKRIVAIDDESAVLPDPVEHAISQKLQSLSS